MRLVQLRLREKWNQVFVAAVAVDNDYFFAPVAGHLISGFLEQMQLQIHAVRYRSGFVLGFEDLAEIIFGKDHRVFLRRSLQRNVAHIQQIGAEREMRSVLFQNAERKKARALGLLDSRTKIRGSKLFPFGGELALRAQRSCGKKREREKRRYFAKRHFAEHRKPPKQRRIVTPTHGRRCD